MKKLVLLCAVLLSLGGCDKKEYDSFGSIYGVVSDNSTGEPLANCTVVLSPGGSSKITGSDGRFEFNELTPQQYTVTVQLVGYQTNRKSVTVIVGEKVAANLPLTQN